MSDYVPTLADLYEAIVDFRHADARAARSSRCKYCGIAQTARLDAARYALIKVCIGLPAEDLDPLLAEPTEEPSS